MSNADIAQTLFLSDGTVKNYVSIIFAKLGVALGPNPGSNCGNTRRIGKALRSYLRIERISRQLKPSERSYGAT